MISNCDLKNYATKAQSRIVLPPQKGFLFTETEEDFKLFEYKSIQKIKSTPTSIKDYFKHFLPQTYASLQKFLEKDLKKTPTNKKTIVIKNIGNMTKSHLVNALRYVAKNSTLEQNQMLNEDFALNSTREVLNDWQQDFCNTRELNEAMHLVFSLNEQKDHTALMALKTSVFHTMKESFADFKFVLVPHFHQNKPHVHVILNKNHQGTGKKMHFADKKACRNFFYQLREDFKNNLFLFSAGMLDYDNPNPQQMLEKKLKDLEKCLSPTPPKKIPHNTTLLLREMMESLQRNALFLEKKNQHLLLEIKKLQNKQKDWTAALQLDKIFSQMKRNHSKINKINAEIRSLFMLEEKTSSFFQHKTLLQQQKDLLSFFSGVSQQYLSKKAYQQLQTLRLQISLAQKPLLSPTTQEYLLKHLPSPTPQQTLYFLSKQSRFLQDCRIFLEEDNLTQEDKKRLTQKIQNLQKQLEDCIKKRKNFLFKKKMELEAKPLSGQQDKEQKYLERITKEMQYQKK